MTRECSRKEKQRAEEGEERASKVKESTKEDGEGGVGGMIEIKNEGMEV